MCVGSLPPSPADSGVSDVDSSSSGHTSTDELRARLQPSNHGQYHSSVVSYIAYALSPGPTLYSSHLSLLQWHRVGGHQSRRPASIHSTSSPPTTSSRSCGSPTTPSPDLHVSTGPFRCGGRGEARAVQGHAAPRNLFLTPLINAGSAKGNFIARAE